MVSIIFRTFEERHPSLNIVGTIGIEDSLMESAELNGIDLKAYLRDILAPMPVTRSNVSPNYFHRMGSRRG